MLIWLGVLSVIGVLLSAGWWIDRRGGSGSTAARAFDRSTRDLARGEHYRFMRRG